MATVEELNPWDLGEDDRQVFTVEITDPKLGSKTLTLFLRTPDEADDCAAADRAAALIQLYIPQNGSEPEQYFPAVGGKRINLSETLIRRCAVIAEMQPPKSKEYPVRYSVEKMIAFAVRLKEGWPKLKKEVDRIIGLRQKPYLDNGEPILPKAPAPGEMEP